MASHARYTRTFDMGANGTGGWTTIVLPYAVQTVVMETTGDSIEWFRAKGESGKQFWLRAFVGVIHDSGVDFANADRWRANMPYLIAVPGQRWGARWNLVGKPLRFVADNVKILSSQMPVSRSVGYEFVGATGTKDINSAYVITNKRISPPRILTIQRRGYFFQVYSFVSVRQVFADLNLYYA